MVHRSRNRAGIAAATVAGLIHPSIARASEMVGIGLIVSLPFAMAFGLLLFAMVELGRRRRRRTFSVVIGLPMSVALFLYAFGSAGIAWDAHGGSLFGCLGPTMGVLGVFALWSAKQLLFGGYEDDEPATGAGAVVPDQDVTRTRPPAT